MMGKRRNKVDFLPWVADTKNLDIEKIPKYEDAEGNIAIPVSCESCEKIMGFVCQSDKGCIVEMWCGDCSKKFTLLRDE